MDKIKLQIISPQKQYSQQLPTVRELAKWAGVESNTFPTCPIRLEERRLRIRQTDRWPTLSERTWMIFLQSRKQLSEQLQQFVTAMKRVKAERKNYLTVLRLY